ncbi:MAG: molybdopterin-synthase adenylyltransferase MoeB [Caulobacteraceae bacterium]|jgi:molybdopterin/thiamine biosynthesis adenylyltransferase|nr:molybdopterin-synthase adenylyltransferase MoeB [Caulobacteraceae bacterium]MBK8544679.1 molybdopterin-synthase adenylyltransferase MoeB [Caulobacteraceae bacterium]MBP6689765.1 molybdopterin-synthase adenylyltransferase MoeB [Hyphomonadaceae bacterium]
MSFSDTERERYARHILLKEIGGPGQQRLKAATVTIVGTGGLGAPAALYLAAAGVGRLRLIDDDAVSLDNLQRQIIFRSADVGASKVERAQDVLAALNDNVSVEIERQRLTEANASYLLGNADVVLDGADDFDTRFAVNAAARASGTPLVSGAVGRWDGQVSVFARGGPCYRCFVPETPPDAETCARVGVVGALTGVIGSMMALEAIKLITQAGEPLIGRVMLFDGLKGEARTVTLKRDPSCPVCGHE